MFFVWFVITSYNYKFIISLENLYRTVCPRRTLRQIEEVITALLDKEQMNKELSNISRFRFSVTGGFSDTSQLFYIEFDIWRLNHVNTQNTKPDAEIASDVQSRLFQPYYYCQ